VAEDPQRPCNQPGHKGRVVKVARFQVARPCGVVGLVWRDRNQGGDDEAHSSAGQYEHEDR
jgi:hypothetical protein